MMEPSELLPGPQREALRTTFGISEGETRSFSVLPFLSLRERRKGAENLTRWHAPAGPLPGAAILRCLDALNLHLLSRRTDSRAQPLSRSTAPGRYVTGGTG
jgi:hypothetical protein